MQNDLDEFFAVADFVNPGLLGSLKSFRSRFAPTESSAHDVVFVMGGKVVRKKKGELRVKQVRWCACVVDCSYSTLICSWNEHSMRPSVAIRKHALWRPQPFEAMNHALLFQGTARLPPRQTPHPSRCSLHRYTRPIKAAWDREVDEDVAELAAERTRELGEVQKYAVHPHALTL